MSRRLELVLDDATEDRWSEAAELEGETSLVDFILASVEPRVKQVLLRERLRDSDLVTEAYKYLSHPDRGVREMARLLSSLE